MNMSEKKPSFSIVIAVRDQNDDLKANLPALLGQKYDSFEVVVVDEHSTDDSSDFLKQQKVENDRLYSTFIPTYQFQRNRRRLAYSIGVKASKNDWIVFADIATTSFSEQWLEELSEFACQPWVLLLGYINKKTGDVRLKTYEDIEKAKQIITRAERRRENEGHSSWMQHLQPDTSYDFIVVRADHAHELLRFFIVSPKLQVPKEH